MVATQKVVLHFSKKSFMQIAECVSNQLLGNDIFSFFYFTTLKIAVKSLQFWQSILLSRNELGLMSCCKQKNRGCQSSGQGHHGKIFKGKTPIVAATSPACNVQNPYIWDWGLAGLVSRGGPVMVLFLHNDVAQNKIYTWIQLVFMYNLSNFVWFEFVDT